MRIELPAWLVVGLYYVLKEVSPMEFFIALLVVLFVIAGGVPAVKKIGNIRVHGVKHLKFKR